VGCADHGLTFESGGRFSVNNVTTYRISQLAETTLRFYESRLRLARSDPSATLGKG
jgi:phage baseplate assembly protein W